MRQYEGESLSAVGQVVVSDDPGAFLSQLSTMSAFNDLQAQLFDDYATELKALDIRREATEKRAAEVAATKKKLADEKATIDDKLAEAKTLLGELKAEEREADAVSRSSRTRPAPLRPCPASGRAAAAVAYAMAQVGDAYVYGAAGPSAFDCSGLTMMAWAQAGVGPAALLERPVQLRPARRRERPAARRPGLLLQPDQPRRHVHRQRHDRARRQPRLRRDDGPAALDAVRRRGPPWLTLAPREGRSPTSGGWPAFRCPCCWWPGWSPGRCSTDDPYVAPARRGAGRAAGPARRSRRRRWRGFERRGRGPATPAPPGRWRLAATRRPPTLLAAVVANARALRRPRLHAALRRRGGRASPPDGSWPRRRRRHLALRRLRPAPGARRGRRPVRRRRRPGRRRRARRRRAGGPRCGCPDRAAGAAYPRHAGAGRRLGRRGADALRRAGPRPPCPSYAGCSRAGDPGLVVEVPASRRRPGRARWTPTRGSTPTSPPSPPPPTARWRRTRRCTCS